MRNKNLITISLSMVLSLVFVAVAVYASTTIDTSINTGGTLDVTGATTLKSTLNVTGATVLLSTLSAGATTLSSTLSVTGQIYASSTALVAGDFTVNGYATTTASSGAFSTRGPIYASSTALVAGSFTVNGFATTTVTGVVVPVNATTTGSAPATCNSSLYGGVAYSTKGTLCVCNGVGSGTWVIASSTTGAACSW